MRVIVPSFAKLNLDLRVLERRPDHFHEVRTVYQTIGLQDKIEIELDITKRSQIDLSSSIDIADNLVVKAARLIMDALRIKAWVRFVLHKRIPMGAGLGGGSSNAAAVLLALPALAGKRVPLADLFRFAETLGSDVPFFLQGGTALGLGRGTELYPLPDLPAHHVLVVSTGVHVSTAEAYRALNRDVTNPLTSPASSPILREFQTITWSLANSRLEQPPLKNDFEDVVFKQHPNLAAVARKLRRAGARPALMTGSGSSLFGVFGSRADTLAATRLFPPGQAFPVRFVKRDQYRSRWRKALGAAAEASCFA